MPTASVTRDPFLYPRKLEMARDYPRESRLFANEMLQGAPRIIEMIEVDLKNLVDEKAKVLLGWMDEGKLARTDPYHLIFRSGRRRRTMPTSTCRCAPCWARPGWRRGASRMRHAISSSCSSMA